MTSSTSTWNAGSFAAASASMKAIRLMPAYWAARSCETRPWRYQSIAAARRISFANASGDSAIGARVSRGNSIRMACSVCCTLMPDFPQQPRIAGTGLPSDPTRDAGRQEDEAVLRRGKHRHAPGSSQAPRSFMRGPDTMELRCVDRPGPARPDPADGSPGWRPSVRRQAGAGGPAAEPRAGPGRDRATRAGRSAGGIADTEPGTVERRLFPFSTGKAGARPLSALGIGFLPEKCNRNSVCRHLPTG